jgi:hypothetical protein
VFEYRLDNGKLAPNHTMVCFGGGSNFPTITVAPALASCLAIAHPKPFASATPATKATFKTRTVQIY